MLEFLGLGWIAALDRAVRATAALRELTDDELVIQQVVTDVPSVGEISYHISLGAGRAGVAAGQAEAPSVTFTTSYETATRINAGKESAQAAFMAGRLRMGGDVTALLRHREALAALDDVLAGVRAETVY